MNSWKIPSYVFNPGSDFSYVNACLLSIWWNHVHGGSQFRRKKTSTSSDIIVTCSHDCFLCYHNVCLFVTWSQVKLRINLSFRNGCWVGSCPVSINQWCCVAWAKYDRPSKMSSKMSLFSCILILVTGKTISRGEIWNLSSVDVLLNKYKSMAQSTAGPSVTWAFYLMAGVGISTWRDFLSVDCPVGSNINGGYVDNSLASMALKSRDLLLINNPTNRA